MEEKSKYRVLVISDTHGDYRRMNEIIRKEFPFDALIHCGDAGLSLDAVLELRDSYELYAVKGNCDSFCNLASVITPRLGKHRLYLTHGHRMGVDDSLKPLLREGLRNGADVVLFGHTHRAVCRYYNEVQILALNPGSLKLPRQYPRIPTYAVLTLEDGKRPEAEIIECPQWK